MGNPLLQSIHEFWPPLFSKMKDLVYLLVDYPNQIRKLPTTQASVPTRHISLFLSNWMEIITNVAVSSDDFFGSRFQAAWPTMVKLLNHCTEVKMSNKYKNLSKTTGDTLDRISFEKIVNSLGDRNSDSEKSNDLILISTLSCIENIFSSSKLGVRLSHLIPVAGTIILPLLSDENEVGEIALKILKCLLSVDCDSLWRPLLKLSGIGLSKEPLVKSEEHRNHESVVIAEHSLLRSRALDLILYVRNLPEQSFPNLFAQLS